MPVTTIFPENIHSLTDFQRNAKMHIHRLKKTGHPQVLTVNGKAELIVQDANAYQKILERLDYWEAVDGVKQGIRGITDGKGVPAGRALKEIRRRLQTC